MHYTESLLEPRIKNNYFYRTLKFTKTQFTNSQRINKPDYYKHYFEEHKNKSKKTWDGIRSIISLKTNSHKQIRSININNKTESSPQIMAETFNNFFVTTASNIDIKIIHTNTSYKDYLQGSVLHSFFLKPVTEKEVISVINEMKTNKSTGPNSIPTHQIIWKPLTYLIKEKTKIITIINQYH